ncbi:hypothetical protein BDW62DRAFT_214591 [Aspergillus aurantiobrunneus]
MLFSLSQRAYRRIYILVAVLALLHFYAFYSHYSPSNAAPVYSVNGLIPADCPSLPGLENVVLVLKTGVTEAHDKLPIHRNTTLRCIPNYIVWSDFDESVADIPVHDVLFNESAHLHSKPDFNLYTRVQTHGRNALTQHDLSDDPSTPFGKTNPGWKLDKWKFVPMIQHTFALFADRPNLDWFVFMEADTYIVWSSLLAWLQKLDARKPYYLGNQMQIADVLFAHGGSGFVLSRPAISRAADLVAAQRDHWYWVTEREWAGDCVLGILLRDAGVNLHWSWPMLQIAPPKEVDHFSANYGHNAWCYPAVTFHHLRPNEIAEIEAAEKSLARRGGRAGPREPLLWRDVYYELGRPKMRQGPVMDWDSEAGEEKAVVRSVETCRILCEGDTSCLQYVRRADGMCLFGRVARVGEAREGFASGWMLDRIDAVAQGLGSCARPEWIL